MNKPRGAWMAIAPAIGLLVSACLFMSPSAEAADATIRGSAMVGEPVDPTATVLPIFQEVEEIANELEVENPAPLGLDTEEDEISGDDVETLDEDAAPLPPLNPFGTTATMGGQRG